MLEHIWNAILFQFNRGPYWEEQQEEHWALEPLDNLFSPPPADVGDVVRVRLQMMKGFGSHLKMRTAYISVLLRARTGEVFEAEVLDNVGRPPRAPARGSLITVYPGHVERVVRAQKENSP